MRVFSLYQDFFKFLEKISYGSDKWRIYFDCYYKLHKEFLESYFSHFPLINSLNLEQRVNSIKKSDYSLLKNLISVCSPEKIINEAYKKCVRIVPPKEEPDAYLFIGFFSPDGFVMDFQGKPVICFGLERFKDFRLFRILFAHEYAHFLLNLNKEEISQEKRLKWLLISEGIGTYFSLLAFPDHRLSDHFLFRRDRLNWCQANESYLREIYCSRKFSSQQLQDFYIMGNPELNLPPRAGKYLGFLAIKRHLTQNKKRNIRSLFSDKKSALSLGL
jgi:hypothetical protein